MLADTDTWLPRTSTGRRIALRAAGRPGGPGPRCRSAPRTRRRTRRRPGGPPCPRSAARRGCRADTDTSTSSPASWPKVSLTSLNWSRSTNSTATRRAGPLGAGQRRVQPVAQQPPVGQVGQTVVQGRVQQHPFGVASAGRVVQADEDGVLARLRHRYHRDDGPQVVAAGVQQAALAVAGPQPPEVVGGGVVVQRAAHQPGGREAEVVAERFVGREHSPGSVDNRHRDGAALEDRTEPERTARRSGQVEPGRGISRAVREPVLRQRPSHPLGAHPPVTQRGGTADPPNITPTGPESRLGQVR